MMQLFHHDIRKSALAGLFFLFFLWGALTCLNTIIIPLLEKLFVFKSFRSFSFGNAFFGSYLIMAIPSAWLIRVTGYKRSMILGLLISALGTILFVLASKFVSYPVFITGFVILATGITLIQVVANTYISIAGEMKLASARLSLAQAINSMGYVLVLAITFNPIFTGQESIVNNARNIQQPYLIIAVLIVIASLIYFRLQFPGNSTSLQKESGRWFSRNRGLYIAATGIFFYVGAELTISRIIQFSFSDTQSSALITIMLLCYWGGMMVGRFAGYSLFHRISPALMLLINGLSCVLIVGTAAFVPPGVMIWFLIVLGLFNAIMFPVLFACGIHQSGHASCFDGAVLIMAISGGALIPALHDQFALHLGLRISLLLLVFCYLVIAAAGYYLYKNPCEKKKEIANV
jgi:FHS family L-fucose permease-like MFS transporter